MRPFPNFVHFVQLRSDNALIRVSFSPWREGKVNNMRGGNTGMAERRPKRGGSRPARLWVVPPGLMTYDEPFEGYRVLDEMRSGAGVTLWEFLRDADLW